MDHQDRVRLAERFASLARQAHPERVHEIILFGSVARGDDGPDSDIDVLFVWDGSRRKGRKELIRLAYPLLLETGEYISVKVLTPEELERGHARRSRFLEAVLAEGHSIA